jgi:hypothetical protein
MIFKKRLLAILILLILLIAVFFPAILSGAYEIEANQVFQSSGIRSPARPTPASAGPRRSLSGESDCPGSS